MKQSKSFLGQGWAFPPTFASDLNAVILSSEEKNIQENLIILFSTQQGERIMNDEYGTNLRSFVFNAPDGDLITEMQDTIRNAILFYEPRIKVADVVVEEDDQDKSILLIRVQYVVRTTNSRRNFVYPFHIHEGTNLIQ
ncbi:MAG: GPW/gp25 family protein [Bacteroidota bacterium]